MARCVDCGGGVWVCGDRPRCGAGAGWIYLGKFCERYCLFFKRCHYLFLGVQDGEPVIKIEPARAGSPEPASIPYSGWEWKVVPRTP
jgi:hypothetical protein